MSERRPYTRPKRLVRLLSLAVVLVASSLSARAQTDSPCDDDAMLIFDASGSMTAADQIGGSGLRRIDRVRQALAKVVPDVAPKRRLGLITYGPGNSAQCENVKLNFPPMQNAGRRILDEVARLKPAGRTPLTRAVRMAAETLSYRERPATIVLLTDGEETCHGDPCKLADTLKADGAKVTIHVITYRIKDALGTDGVFESRCLAEKTSGLFVETETSDELIAALKSALTCTPIVQTPPADAGAIRSRLGSNGR